MRKNIFVRFAIFTLPGLFAAGLVLYYLVKLTAAEDDAVIIPAITGLMLILFALKLFAVSHLINKITVKKTNELLDELKNKEAEITGLRNSLEEAACRAEHAERVKRAFFNSVSHEIRTPMNAVIGMTELLSDGELSGEQIEKIIAIKTFSDVMMGIINDLMDFSAIDEGSFTLSPLHYDFPLMLKSIASAVRLLAADKGLVFISDFSGGLPRFLYGDSFKLRQILMNLLSNAVKFTDSGEVKFSVSVKEQGENVLEFTVSDTGSGIKPDDVARLFEPFGQIDGKSRSGAGLGLVITDNIVRMMNGKITVESIFGFGTAFRVEIPFEEGRLELVGREEDETAHVVAPNAEILLVDDIKVNLSVGAGFLRLHNIIPDVTESAREAIRMICEKDYDIVFMDHMMPDIDGEKATKIIRGFGGKYAQGRLKIIALTANVTPDAVDVLLSSGMDDFLPKPVTKANLNRMLMKWLPEGKRTITTKKVYREIPPNEYSEAVNSAKKIQGINVKTGLRRTGGVEEFESSLKLLSLRIPKSVETFERCLSDGRLWEFSVEAHGLKGALAISGMDEYSGIAGELETFAKSEDADACAKKLIGFKRSLEELKTAIDELFIQEEELQKEQGEADMLAQMIDNLSEDVARFDRASALDEIGRVRGYTFGEKGDRLINNVKADLENFDYDAALEKLQIFKI